MNSADVVPVLLGACLVVAAAMLALLPLLRPARAPIAGPLVGAETGVDRFQLYRNVLELELDYDTGKLSAEDYAALSGELLGRAADQLREARGRLDDVDDEVEREIAAARAAFASARRAPSASATTGQTDVARGDGPGSWRPRVPLAGSPPWPPPRMPTRSTGRWLGSSPTGRLVARSPLASPSR